MHRALIVGTVILVACGQPLLTPPPAVRPMTPDDPRRVYVGAWRVQFAFDSTRYPVRPEKNSQMVTRTLSGTLNATFHLCDTVTDVDGRHLASVWQYDSTDALRVEWMQGARDSTTLPFPRAYKLQRTILEAHGSRLTLQFAPTGCDACAYPYIESTYQGDSIVGAWRIVGVGYMGYNNLEWGVYGRVRMFRVVARADSIGACVWTSPPGPRHLTTGDWRKEFLGTWRAQLTFDRLRGIVELPSSSRLNALLHLRDMLVDPDGWGVASSLEFDSLEVPLVRFPRRQGSDTLIRFFPRARDLRTAHLDRDGSRVRMAFWPSCGDCAALSLEGTNWGDSIVGTWRYGSLVRLIGGPLRMVRVVADADSR
jgi:hypothetical protein